MTEPLPKNKIFIGVVVPSPKKIEQILLKETMILTSPVCVTKSPSIIDNE